MGERYVGVVKEIEDKGENRPLKVTVGYDQGGYSKSKKFICWKTKKDASGQPAPNPVVAVLEANYISGNPVEVEFSTKTKEYNGKSFPENTIWDAKPYSDPWAQPTIVTNDPTETGALPEEVNTLTPVSSFFDVIDQCFKEAKDAVDELRKAVTKESV